ncbi:MAG TPA: hypothetical protein DCW74_14580 [Alteromonas australica]|uniref:Uncharacterized protein n=1 Tax=Alteromonas australica TaxID=589873 RepID=A0A350P6M9_9ALTE|nr:hypothetical protein [Alteromonas australica]|tara:strand:+ start:150 stop:668 length:519 start_codon:yes stop_codon:yes gene_type:complete
MNNGMKVICWITTLFFVLGLAGAVLATYPEYQAWAAYYPVLFYISAVCVFVLMVCYPSEIMTKALIFAGGIGFLKIIIPKLTDESNITMQVALSLGDPLIAGAAGSLVALEAQKYVTDHPPGDVAKGSGNQADSARFNQLKNEIDNLKTQVTGGQALIAILLIINIIVLLFK